MKEKYAAKEDTSFTSNVLSLLFLSWISQDVALHKQSFWPVLHENYMGQQGNPKLN